MARFRSKIVQKVWLPGFVLGLAVVLVMVWLTPRQEAGAGREPSGHGAEPFSVELKVSGDDEESIDLTSGFREGVEAAGIPAPEVVPAPEPPPISTEGKIALREMMRRDFEGLQEEQREDGGASLSLQGRFMHMSAFVVGADGEDIIHCFCCAEDLFARVTPPGTDLSSK